MSQRRKVSSDVSAAVVTYVLREKRLTQEELAEAIEVSPAFISRVRTGERSLTVDHLKALEGITGVPLGALLLAAVPLPEPTGKMKKLHEMAREAIAQADRAAEAVRRHQAHAG